MASLLFSPGRGNPACHHCQWTPEPLSLPPPSLPHPLTQDPHLLTCSAARSVPTTITSMTRQAAGAKAHLTRVLRLSTVLPLWAEAKVGEDNNYTCALTAGSSSPPFLSSRPLSCTKPSSAPAPDPCRGVSKDTSSLNRRTRGEARHLVVLFQDKALHISCRLLLFSLLIFSIKDPSHLQADGC